MKTYTEVIKSFLKPNLRWQNRSQPKQLDQQELLKIPNLAKKNQFNKDSATPTTIGLQGWVYNTPNER